MADGQDSGVEVSTGGHREASVTPARLQTMFVLLFPTRAPSSFAGFGEANGGIEPLPPEDAGARMEQLREVEVALLGTTYLESRRMVRWPLGRVRLPQSQQGPRPDHADVFLVTHTAGAAVWECWIPAPEQPLDAARYVAWLRFDGAGSLVALLRERIGNIDRRLSSLPDLDDCFPLTILRSASDHPSVDLIVAEQGADLVRLLYLDRSSLPLKEQIVGDELGRDFCLHEGGVSLLSQRSALDLRTNEVLESVDGALVLPPRSALPLLVSVELLLIERAVLRLLHERLVDTEVPESMQRLIDLKAQVLDGLEEYRGTVAESNRFSGEVTAYGERVLGIDALYRALNERLDGVTFEITTGYQQTTNVLQFSLTVVLGALTASYLAAAIAIVHYGHDLLPIVLWAAGAGLATAAAVVILLRSRLR